MNDVYFKLAVFFCSNSRYSSKRKRPTENISVWRRMCASVLAARCGMGISLFAILYTKHTIVLLLRDHGPDMSYRLAYGHGVRAVCGKPVRL